MSLGHAFGVYCYDSTTYGLPVVGCYCCCVMCVLGLLAKLQIRVSHGVMCHVAKGTD